jgi:hypothetical protein
VLYLVLITSFCLTAFHIAAFPLFDRILVYRSQRPPCVHPRSQHFNFDLIFGIFIPKTFNFNEENSPTFNRRVSPLVGAATQESNVWVLSVKERKKEK